ASHTSATRCSSSIRTGSRSGSRGPASATRRSGLRKGRFVFAPGDELPTAAEQAPAQRARLDSERVADAFERERPAVVACGEPGARARREETARMARVSLPHE